MAEAIVPHLLSLVPMVQNQCSRFSKYKRYLANLEFFIKELDQYLREANAKETIPDNVRTSMQQARRLLYDAQDAIDDLMRRESNSTLKSLSRQLRKLCRRRRFVSEAEDIQERMNFCLTTINQFTLLKHQLPADRDAHISANLFYSTAVSMENDARLEGIDEARKQLVEWLIEDDSMSKVIFLHGAQGVGKTSLVGTVFRHAEVKGRFKFCVWVEHYNKRMDSYVVVLDLTENDRKQVKLRKAFQLMKDDEDLRNNGKRWALILDDAREASVIKDVQCQLDLTYPSVLITTRDSSLESCAKELASAFRTSTCTPGEPSGGAPPEKHRFLSLVPEAVANLASSLRACLNSQQAKSNGEAPDSLNGFRSFKHVPLPMEHSLNLLCRTIEIEDPSGNSDKVIESILKTCEGLPLAILAIRELLMLIRDDNNGTLQGVRLGELENRLGENLLYKRRDADHIKRMITLRMDQLYDVRACLFYLSIFPLDCPIRHSTLMRLWVAEKFAMKEDGRTDQAIAEEKLKRLLDHNFIWEVEKTSYGRVRTCRIHNLQREIIMKKSKDDEFAMIVADQEEEWPETIWRLSLHCPMNPMFQRKIDFTKDKVKRLRSLLVFKDVYLDSIKELLKYTNRLNVLHLEASSLNTFLGRISSLIYLRYLKFSTPHVVAISNDIRHLVYLETLDLKGTCVHELPDGILELKELRHLLVYTSNRRLEAVDPKLGVKVPSALGNLNSLQKLCMIELNSVKSWMLSRRHWRREQLLEELGKLTSLQRLGISMLTSTDGELLCSSIEKLTKLEALHLIATQEAIVDLSEMENERKAPALLQRVHLTGCFGKLLYWLLSSESLVKLVLKRSQLNEDPLQHLGNLQSLQHLELHQAFNVHEMTFNAEWFPQLRFLGLNTIDSLRTIRVDEEALPTLEILSLARCPSLKRVPEDIRRPRNLSCLRLLDMPEEFERSVEENGAVREKMTVEVKHWIDGAVNVAVPLPDRPAGSPSNPCPLKK